MAEGLGSRSSSTQAMLSLVSAYDDDDDKDRSMDKDEEEQDGGGGVKEEEGGDKTQEESVDDRLFSGSEDEESESRPNSKINTPDELSPGPSTPKKQKLVKRVMKLVSYGDQYEDDEGEEEGESDTEEGDDSAPIQGDASVEYTSQMSEEVAHVRGHDIDGEDLLPPEPKGTCSKHLQEKVLKLYEKKQRGMDLNQNIQRKKEFRNPSIYEKLIQFCGIDEKGTNYPPELYDPSIWGPESYYTELARIQKEEMDKREKERKDKTKIEFVSGVKRESSIKIPPERKSKWDTQSAKAGPEVLSSNVQTSASGNKTTVISAVGTLKKSK